MKKYFLLLFCIFIILIPALAEENYNDWIGKEIVFLPMPSSLQKYGYQLFNYQPTVGGSIPYNDLANKFAIITDIKDDNGILQATIKTEDGKIVYGQGYGGNFEHIAFKSELENAIKEYSEKTVWSKVNLKKTPYVIDPKTDKPINITLPNIEKYIVQNIEWGTYDSWPLKFTLVNTNGDIIYWTGSYSRINDTSNHLMQPFKEYWHLSNPQNTYPKWSQKTWNLIKEYKVSIGMNKDMVLMSWGEPKKVNKTVTAKVVSEQWIYSLDEYVYFENGVVTGIQN